MKLLLCLASLLVVAAVVEGGQMVEKWGRFELALESSRHYENPFRQVELTCRFQCGDESITTWGFYDGEGLWRVRLMPTRQGRWTYRTTSNDPDLDGKRGTFRVGPPAPGNHGPIVIRNTYHFAYADGTPFFPLGTTLYNWLHRESELQEQTLATLRKHAFNKVRFCVFPKWYDYNRVEPPLYPWPRNGRGFDRDRFNPAFFRHIEARLDDLQALGIVADIILFHPYDRWGHSTMTAEQDDAYLKYVVSRLAHWRNVWWTMANEYDLMKAKKIADWDRFFQLVAKYDPYDHPRSNHNCGTWYDHSKPWVTHCNIQNGHGDLYQVAIRARRAYHKPVVIDEYGYEGNIPRGWGNRSPQEETHRHWCATIGGAYASHGETYYNKEEKLWWAVGGKLIGKSPPRLAFLKKIMEQAPYEQMAPEPDFATGAYTLARPGSYYLVYFPRRATATFDLPGPRPYKLEGIDTWEMTIESLGSAGPGRFAFPAPKAGYLLRLVQFKEGEGVPPRPKATARPTEGKAPLQVTFAVEGDWKCQWDFGDGASSTEKSPTHTYAAPGTYTVKLLATDRAGNRATTFLSVTADISPDQPIVRVGFPEPDQPPTRPHGPIRRGKDGTLDFGKTEPWKWLQVGQGPIETLEGLRSLTILGWLQAASLKMGNGGNRIACNLNYNRSGFDLVCLSDGRLRLAVNQWPDRVKNDSSPGKIRVGRRVFFAVTYDATKKRDNVRWYFGDADAPATLDRVVTYNNGPTGQGSGPLTIGNYNQTLHRHGLDRQFRGWIKRLMVFGSKTGAAGALSLEAIRRWQQATR